MIGNNFQYIVVSVLLYCFTDFEITLFDNTKYLKFQNFGGRTVSYLAKVMAFTSPENNHPQMYFTLRTQNTKYHHLNLASNLNLMK